MCVDSALAVEYSTKEHIHMEWRILQLQPEEMQVTEILSVLKRVAERLTIGLVVLDKEQKIIVFNKKAGELLQEKPGPRIGSSILRCHPERAESGVMEMVNQFKNGQVDDYEGFVHFRGGFLYEYIYPVWDDNGEYLATVAEMHECPERIEYLKNKGEWDPPEEHGVGPSSPRSPFPNRNQPD